MKRYFQIIIGKPKKETTYKDVEVRRVEHGKPLTAYQRKLVMFRNRVMEHTNGESINSDKFTKEERIKIRKEALKYASL